MDNLSRISNLLQKSCIFYYINQKDGRDKILKIIQYFARLIRYYIPNENYILFEKLNIISRIFHKHIKKIDTIGNTRKCFNMMRIITAYILLQNSLSNKKYTEDLLGFLLQICKKITVFLFWIMDTCSLLQKIGILPFSHMDIPYFR